MMKGITGSVFLIVAGAISLFLGIWIVSIVINQIQLPTGPITVSNESITFTLNNTYYAFPSVAASKCLTDQSQASVTCGVQTSGVTAILNATNHFGNATASTLGNVSYNSTYIKIITNDQVYPGVWRVSYQYYDFSVPGAGTALDTSVTTVYNAFVLMSVGLIVVAAVIIISYFSFRRQ